MSGRGARRAGTLERLIAALPEAVLLACTDGHIEAANAWSEILLKTPAGALAGSNLLELAAPHEEDALRYLRACARSGSMLPGALTLGESRGAPLRLRAEGALVEPAGAHGPALVLLRLARPEEALAQFSALNLRIEGLNREIGRRRLAEQGLRESHELLRVTLSSIGDAVIATDAAGRVTFMNPVAESFTGWTQSEAAGRALDEVFVIVNEATRAAVESPVARVLRENAVVGLANHTVLIRRDGAELPIDDSGAPIRDPGGRVLGVVLVFRDIGERRMVERERAEADRRKDEFLAMLAHELRNPLAAIAAGVELVCRQAPPDLGAAGEVMRRQVRQLARLVDDLLDVSRITRGSILLRRAPVALHSVIDDALAAHRPSIEARAIRAEVTLPREPVLVEGDAERLSQVVGNLLANAVKFSPAAGRVQILLDAREERATVRVVDEGTGIPAELLPRVFDLFVQGDTSPARARGGLGVGLTIARLIAEMHGGHIEVASEGKGRGATFTLQLPLLGKEKAPAAPEEPVAKAARARRILVVDDNADAAASLAALLRLGGHEVTTAQSGEAALRLQEAAPAEVLLLDIGMPDMDGYELARQLRRRADGSRLLLVALTGYGAETDRRRAAAAGFDAYLTKPADLHELERLLRAGCVPP